MEATSTPRVSGPFLDNYVGRNVMVVGKVVQLRGDQAIIDADGNVTAHLNRDAHLSVGNGAQLIGKVNPDLSIKVLSSLNLQQSVPVDFDLCRTVVELTQLPSVKGLFVNDASSGGGVYN
ncbi:hypothetical protein NKR19_g4238 [Coniochaeta hoffmannii]|uniref:Replication factor A protein 3 n=1 Tax=Coniochaeta hoffmannii TaxID=91930 RepID=A0AA38VW32_9PEZI|nr:hypothetical protein NKR19_g4238 [Coniochaeta hoffmannii]